MAQENVDKMRRSLEIMDRRDREAWLALRHEDCEVIAIAAWPEAESVRGREAAWKFYMDAMDPFEWRGFADAEIVDAGPDRVLVHAQNELHGRASGAAVEMNYWAVVTFRDGKILQDEWFADRGQALAAAGLAE